MLEIRNLEIGYKQPIFGPLSKPWGSSGCVCLLGDNGKGKSTFIKTLVGVLAPLQGNVAMANDAKVGWVQSNLSRVSFLTINDYLTFGNEQVSIALIKEWLFKFGLQTLELTVFIDEISDGQFRKLSIIRQLLKSPNILFLDEPTVYLDLTSKQILAGIINEMKTSCLVFCASHDIHLIESIATERLHF